MRYVLFWKRPMAKPILFGLAAQSMPINCIVKLALSAYEWPKHSAQHKIRFQRIDAPERAQPFSDASREYLASLVTVNKAVPAAERAVRKG